MNSKRQIGLAKRSNSDLEHAHRDSSLDHGEDLVALVPNRYEPESFWQRSKVPALAFLAALVIVAPIGYYMGKGTSSSNDAAPSSGSGFSFFHKHHNQNELYQCPSVVYKAKNDNYEGFFDEYVEDYKKKIGKTLEELRSMEVSDWEVDYPSFKEVLRPWKERYYVPNVKSGAKIYESGCGMGLNLLLTAEILEEHGRKNVTVYGSDYFEDSVKIANQVFDEPETKLFANKGQFCRADATELDFIEDNTFDLVFTGYIEPRVDPLHLSANSDNDDDGIDRSHGFCKSDDEKQKQMALKEQAKQEYWFASWVEEMIRIVKPGHVIGVENVAESLCTNEEEWGGVDMDWWTKAAEYYEWEVDPKSIVIRKVMDNEQFEGRYHVVMRKSMAGSSSHHHHHSSTGDDDDEGDDDENRF